MMRGGTVLILGHGVKGQVQLWRSVYKALLVQNRLQFMSNHFQTSIIRGETLMILGHRVIGQGHLPPPPCEGMSRFALSSYIKS